MSQEKIGQINPSKKPKLLDIVEDRRILVLRNMASGAVVEVPDGEYVELGGGKYQVIILVQRKVK